MSVESTTSSSVRSTPLIAVVRFVPFHRRSGNALCFADVEITHPPEGRRLYPNLKLCKNGSARAFLSEPQIGHGPNAARKLYVIEDFSLRMQIERALLERYECEEPGQLALFEKECA
jgi:hypothetical protein